MKKSISIAFLFWLLPQLVFSQIGYFKTDTSMNAGVTIKDGGQVINSRYMQLIKGDEIIKMYPDKITEYGFIKTYVPFFRKISWLNSDRVFVSKRIFVGDTSKMVFLEQLVQGKTNLYFYADEHIQTFFAEKENTGTVQIPKGQKGSTDYFRNKLETYTVDCDAVKDAAKLVRYNKHSLSLFVKRYNNCVRKPFPHVKFGFLAGYEFSKFLSPSNPAIYYLNLLDYSPEGSFMYGIFLDLPLRITDFSLHAELSHSTHGYLHNEHIDEKEVDLVINTSSLKMPLLFRYTYPSVKIRPFINFGGIVNYNLKNNTIYLETKIHESVIEYDINQNAPRPENWQTGFAFGGGLEYDLNYRKSLSFEVRHNRLSGDERSLQLSDWQFITGFNF
ncbi:outer membrane beta-barrel protein [Mariniphaga sp.]|uniref:outer membrane beta-barrel protein n=1 Tax=Mariniphaga sp. TaxID=1954475 RepID=UPI003566EDE6